MAEHNTPTAYTRGCRCKLCRRAWADYIARRRREARAGRYFAGETRRAHLQLTRLGLGIAQAVAARTGSTVDAVVEGALRCCGHRVRF